MIILFIIGGFICFLNFYLSFLRQPIHKLISKHEKAYKPVSGLPIIGSIFVFISLLFLYKYIYFLIFGLILIIIDTGGIHWFLGVILFENLKNRK